MNLIHTLTISMLLWTIRAQTMIQYLDKFTRNVQFDGKKCKDSDIVYQGMPLSRPQCASKCRISPGCSGFMYNWYTKTCIGCRGRYTDDTILDTEGNTLYFEGDWHVFHSTSGDNLNGNFFKFTTSKWNFTDGMAYCRLNGGNLARIDTEEKYQFSKKILAGSKPLWIGLTDEDQEGVWTWVYDGRVANFTRWGSGQPYGNGDCARAMKATNYKWADTKCKDTYPIVCERRWS